MPSDSPPPAQSIPPPPSTVPAPTGDLITDATAVIYNCCILRLTSLTDQQSIRNINHVPCARESLLTGIVSGAGVGFVRGMVTSMLQNPTNNAALQPDSICRAHRCRSLVCCNFHAGYTRLLVCLGHFTRLQTLLIALHVLREVCRWRMANERQQVQQIIERSGPKKAPTKPDEQPSDSANRK
jgi:hypothetical protein